MQKTNIVGVYIGTRSDLKLSYGFKGASKETLPKLINMLLQRHTRLLSMNHKSGMLDNLRILLQVKYENH